MLSKKNNDLWFYAILLLLIPVFLIVFSKDQIFTDELHHMSQIRDYLAGNFAQLPELTTFTTYHHFIAAIAKIFNVSSVFTYRMINLCLAVTLMFFYILIIKIVNPKVLKARILQTIFLPIIFPLYYLVYTDIMALLMFTIAVYYFLQGRNKMVLLFATFAVLVRQPNLVWFVLFPTILFFEDFSLQNIPSKVVKNISWIFVGLLFVLYFYISGSIAAGDKSNHQVSFNISNVFFLVNVMLFVFLPIFLSRYMQVFDILYKYKWLIFIIIALYPLYHYEFTVTHRRNHVATDYFIRNFLLNIIADNFYAKIISYIMFCYTILALTSIKLIHKKWNWLYIFAPLSVIPMPLIEQRYYMIAFVLWQLVRISVNKKIEYLNAAWCLVFSVYFYIGIMQGQFFL